MQGDTVVAVLCDEGNLLRRGTRQRGGPSLPCELTKACPPRLSQLAPFTRLGLLDYKEATAARLARTSRATSHPISRPRACAPRQAQTAAPSSLSADMSALLNPTFSSTPFFFDRGGSLGGPGLESGSQVEGESWRGGHAQGGAGVGVSHSEGDVV